MNRLWSDSLLPLSRGGTHPGLRPPLRGGDRKGSSLGTCDAHYIPRWPPCAVPVCGRGPGVRASSPQAAKMAALPGACQERNPPRPSATPPRRGAFFTSPLGRERGNVSSSQTKKLDTFPLCAASAVGWVLPVLLAVAMTSAGCAVVPLSLYQTLPSTRMALSSTEGAQRSLGDIRADYEDSLETDSAERPVAAYGATHGAYQRWVTDEVRELPDVSQTIAIGGGDT